MNRKSHAGRTFQSLLLIFSPLFLTTVIAQDVPHPLVLQYSSKVLDKDGVKFRDLNENGKMDVYENSAEPVDSRVANLMEKMTLEEKAGMLFIDGVPVSSDARADSRTGAVGTSAFLPTAAENIEELHMSHFNIWETPADPADIARWYNDVQKHAENTRLGIPVTLASDPRHHFSDNIYTLPAQGFTRFCEPIGFAAIRDTAVMRRFADIARQEYLAVGIREALHPQLDLSTEPRWPRIGGAFGSDAELTAELGRTYILGFQGRSLTDQSVACMTKHFPGGGPQKDGLDPHFEFQQGQIYPGGNFDYHLIPFEAAIEANTASMMPYYGIPIGQTTENVGMAFNKDIISGLLRDKYNYDGVVCTDWGLITDINLGFGSVWPARAWGLDSLSEEDRAWKILQAGCDQFGGEKRPELIIQLVRDGKLDEERLDVSVRRLLRQKFELGLFDNPFVDPGNVADMVASPTSIAFGDSTQQMAMTLLKNTNSTLPLKRGIRVYIENMDSSTVAEYTQVVSAVEDADLAIIRLNTPWYPVKTNNAFARGFHHGDLDFQGEEKARIMQILDQVPTVVDIYLDRPAVIPDIAQHCAALIANFGASDKNVCEVLFGNSEPKGRLPFELPSSMEAVRNQKTDVPYDSKDPLFRYNFGLNY